MAQPYNYMIDIGNPVQSALQGYQAAQNMQLNQERIAAIQARRQQEQEMLRQQQDQQRRIQEFAAIPNKTYEDYARFNEQNPLISKVFDEQFSRLTEKQKQGEIFATNRLFNLLKSNNVDAANMAIDERMEAYRNSGDEEQAKFLEMMKEQLNMGEEGRQALMDSAGALLAHVDPRFKETAGRDLLKEQKTMAETGKLVAETAKIWQDINGMGDKEKEERLRGLEKEQRDMVKTLWSNLDSQLAEFRKADAANRKLQNISKSAEKGDPAAQLAMVFNFMKINDPGSVVRESEFNTAAQARAFIEKVDNGDIKVNAKALPGLGYLRKLALGQILTDSQVRDFVNTSNNLWAGQQENADMIVNDIIDRAESQNVSPEVVIGKTRYSEWKSRRKPKKEKPERTVTRTGTYNGKKVIQYSDGSVEYAD